MSAPSIDDVAQTLAQYESLAITSGARVQIDPPEFSTDGSVWLPFWIETTPPVLARATVHRDGIPTTVVVAWGESLPAEESWRALWTAKPMKLFGAYALRAALRRAFREVIGDRREPDESDPAAAWAPAEARDWDAEIATTVDAAAVHALHSEMKQARAVTPTREGALRGRLLELSSERVLVESGVRAPGPELSSEERATHDRFFPPPARPRDHLAPQNRAARRAKGRRR